MTTDAGSAFDLFRQIIAAFRRRPDPAEGLTLLQIANMVFGLGGPQKAAIVGRAINDFTKYFRKHGIYKVCVNWRLIEEDHPDLLASRRPAAAVPPAAPIQEMLKALEDERRSVQEELKQRPIAAAIVREVARFPDNTFMYEADVVLSGDADFPIPEGVALKAQWYSPYLQLRGALLAWDPMQSRIIFEVDQEIPSANLRSNLTIIPAIDELIMAVRDRLKASATEPGTLPMRLLGTSVRATSGGSGRVESTDLDDPQRESIRRCLTQDITFLWGPPGTGKTHTLARLMAHLALSGKRVVAVAIANVAVDQLASQLVKALAALGSAGERLLDDGQILRFGHPRLPEVIAERRLFPNREEIQRLRKALHEAQLDYRKIPERDTQGRALQQKVINDLRQSLRDVTKTTVQSARVVLTTAVQTCIEASFASGSFDAVIIDEASMMPVPYAVCAASMAKERVVVGGDFRQLGPIAIATTDVAMRWLHKDCFTVAGIEGANPEHPGLTMLTCQRRMHRDIREMVNAPFYSGKLTGEAPVEKTASVSLAPGAGAATVLVKATLADGSATRMTEGHSRANDFTAQLTTDLAVSLAKRLLDGRIGVITPYRAQVALIKRLVKDAGLAPTQLERIRIGTVHAFQGSEADVVVWDLVDSRSAPVGRLYHGEAGNRLANVAISRAQGKLIVVGDPDSFFETRGAEMVKALKNILFIAFAKGKNTLTPAEARAFR